MRPLAERGQVERLTVRALVGHREGGDEHRARSQVEDGACERKGASHHNKAMPVEDDHETPAKHERQSTALGPLKGVRHVWNGLEQKVGQWWMS